MTKSRIAVMIQNVYPEFHIITFSASNSSIAALESTFKKSNTCGVSNNRLYFYYFFIEFIFLLFLYIANKHVGIHF